MPTIIEFPTTSFADRRVALLRRTVFLMQTTLFTPNINPLYDSGELLHVTALMSLLDAHPNNPEEWEYRKADAPLATREPRVVMYDPWDFPFEHNGNAVKTRLTVHEMAVAMSLVAPLYQGASPATMPLTAWMDASKEYLHPEDNCADFVSEALATSSEVMVFKAREADYVIRELEARNGALPELPPGVSHVEFIHMHALATLNMLKSYTTFTRVVAEHAVTTIDSMGHGISGARLN